MIILLRAFLIGMIIYLVLRSFAAKGEEETNKEGSPVKNIPGGKKISKSVGEYIDYEELSQDNDK